MMKIQILKNRLELLKMFCKTFNNFIDFSKSRRCLNEKLVYRFKINGKTQKQKEYSRWKRSELSKWAFRPTRSPGFTISTKFVNIFYKNKKKFRTKY